jgi:Meckel syndrome type 1 protein
MFRAKHSKFVYRVALLERPSMWRFVLLSALLHIWLVVLFGDASGGRRDSASWSRTFVATLERDATAKAGTPGTRGGAAQSLPVPIAAASLLSPAPAQAPAKVSEDVAASPNKPMTEVASSSASASTEVPAPLKPLEIEKIPAIAVEVSGAVTPFSIAPIVVQPLSPAVSSIAPAVSPIPPLRASTAPAVSAGEVGFAVYVPPIVERAAVATTPAPVLATPALPALAKPQVEREFATYVAPPVVPAVPAPSVTLDAMALPSPSVVAPAAPSVQVAAPRPVDVVPIATEPIAPLTLSPATKVLEIYQPRAVDVSVNPASSAPSAVAARESSASAAQSEGKTAAGSAATATTLSPSSTGAGASALLNAPLPLPAPLTPFPSPTGSPANAPRLDLDQLRRQARDVAKEGGGSRALLPFPTVAKEAQKKDMEKIFDKALKRPDCKEAYADLGLLAVVPLLRDAAKDGGCKW